MKSATKGGQNIIVYTRYLCAVYVWNRSLRSPDRGVLKINAPLGKSKYGVYVNCKKGHRQKIWFLFFNSL